MEIEVGEYIRTNNGEIAKVIYNATNEFCDKERLALDRVVSVNNSEFIYRDDIVKHSKNIIDLIEEGDYVNGDEVIAIDYAEDENGNAFNVLGVYDIDDDYAYTIELSIIHIKSILTKEQYEQNSFKL